jgi:uncharacterized membrane protein
MPRLERSIEIEAPLSKVYDQWTQFEEFPRFMDGVLDVRQLDDSRLRWRARIAGQEREWTAEITEQVPNSRIAWESLSGTPNRGAITFEPIGEGGARARVTVQVDYEPEGWIESLADALGLVSMRVDGALEAFRESIEGGRGATGAWRGRIPGAAAPLPAPEVPSPEASAKGSEMRVIRCPLHGIAIDIEREECPECAKTPARR